MEVVFRWKYDGDEIFLVGDWMEKRSIFPGEKYGVRIVNGVARVKVPLGDHLYKFIVDGRPCYDLEKPVRASEDGSGSVNNFIHIPENEASVMSLNVRVPKGGVATEHDWNSRSLLIVELIKKHRPAIVCLQECFEIQVSAICQRTKCFVSVDSFIQERHRFSSSQSRKSSSSIISSTSSSSSSSVPTSSLMYSLTSSASSSFSLSSMRHSMSIHDITQSLPSHKVTKEEIAAFLKKGFCSIIWDKEQAYPVDAGEIWLSETPDIPLTKFPEATSGRKASWAVLRMNFNHGVTLFVCSVHLDFASASLRMLQIDVLLKKIDELNARYDYAFPIILCGDFCEGKSTLNGVYTRLKENGFEDLWRASPIRNDNGCLSNTYHGFFPHTSKTPSGTSLAVSSDMGYYDWILAKQSKYSRGNFPTVVCTPTHSDIITDCEEDDFVVKYPSDHFPVSSSILFAIEK